MTNATNVQFEGTDEMVVAFATAREAAEWALQGFYDGTAFYILDQRREPGCHTVWKRSDPDYRLGHARMVAEIARRVISEALTAALVAWFGDEEKPRYTTRRLRLETDRAFERGRQQAFDEMLTAMHDGIPPTFSICEQVEKHTGDYTARGEVRAVFAMKNGAIRFVVEHQAEGGGSFCHIYSEKNLRKVAP
ncbi:hypothetical protein [Ciceribacter ferrooxidans]|uniref:Uncharacterized protein n=1 Tax=Ciceribacter ferrooxidans TaxID=2509717 RepID=A0A4Q2SXG3_9HYPH|nr:hypothetical protein [Ciceribacter ferrooxidans]RYC10131.1 hypothetical protein EUU22_18865 [Ciceribacter ferrooxidans]